ncbi:uncharacterized protein LOC135952295 [Calliphora vicina]|uniref:uncharacterized protein LOC135952295 n=1 Tax=Calliphora vicina TaxID=7373 RepID=UPI00325AE97E
MKLLYTVIILGLIQLVVLRPLEASISLQDELMELYNSELDILGKEFCERAKAMSKNILQNKYVQQAKTPVMRKFKQNIKDFLHDYPSYIRYGLIHELVLLFGGIIPDVISNADTQYISELLIIQGYNEFDEDYESKCVEFVQDIFLPKFEELKLKLSQDELQQEKTFINLCNKLKQCHDYFCQSKYFMTMLEQYISPKKRLYYFIVKQLDIIDIFRGNNENNIASAVIKDQKLSQLSPAVRQHLIISLNNFIMKFESNEDVVELHDLNDEFNNNILMKFYYNRKLPSKDRRLLMEIFNKNGYAKFVSNYRLKFNGFIEQGLLKELKTFQKSLSRKELKSEKNLIKCFVQSKALTNFSERYDQFEKCFVILQNELETETI